MATKQIPLPKRKNRVIREIQELVKEGVEVRLAPCDEKNCLSELYVLIHGPDDTLYAQGSWYIHLTIPKDYPLKSPSVGFKEPVWHPNICYKSGSVCLNALNQDWSPIYNLLKVTRDLKVLLAEPNFDDPLNMDAAKLFHENRNEYEIRVRKVLEESNLLVTRSPPGHLLNGTNVKKIRQNKWFKSKKCGSREAVTPPTKGLEMKVAGRQHRMERLVICRPFDDADLAMSEPDEDSDEYDEDYSEIEYVEVDDEEDEDVRVVG